MNYHIVNMSLTEDPMGVTSAKWTKRGFLVSVGDDGCVS